MKIIFIENGSKPAFALVDGDSYIYFDYIELKQGYGSLYFYGRLVSTTFDTSKKLTKAIDALKDA
jgi:hypothetical protein